PYPAAFRVSGPAGSRTRIPGPPDRCRPVGPQAPHLLTPDARPGSQVRGSRTKTKKPLFLRGSCLSARLLKSTGGLPSLPPADPPPGAILAGVWVVPVPSVILHARSVAGPVGTGVIRAGVGDGRVG